MWELYDLFLILLFKEQSMTKKSYISTFFRNWWCRAIDGSIFAIRDYNIIAPKNSSISSLTICTSLTINASLGCPFSKNIEK